ncbi:MAG TPA: dipeptidase [Cyclobacteriaceae bacterium]|nr:dipeptidase [Cyclobacteriaceae bacterium]MCB9237577.1 membrane dipeptidase [Flammeovirgaceae bacterium]MCB0498909.1 dipeptidase [Cyclobacteriaceae bacterium]MCO5270321.1 dipeptidase [Cyclobacteriaceae bacterium]MCW5902297.1 dipeptidase [Cyclobacteriaceae bacterium]
MKLTYSLLCVFALLLCGCGQKKTTENMTDEELHAYADELAHRFIITDTHIDVPYRLKEQHINVNAENANVLVSTTEGDFDYDRAKKGGLDAPFMSIYIPSEYQQEADMGKAFADSLIDNVVAITKNLPDKFALANSPQEVEANFKAGKISLPMGMENGAPFGNDLANVKYFYDRGIRYTTLTHGKDNQICDSSYDTTGTHGGLSDFGRQVVAEMNRVGIMVDISHVDDDTFYQVMELSKAPAIASHSSCRFFTPGFERNMSDDMIKALGAKGGVIQINIGSSFLDSAVVQANKANTEKLNAMLKEAGLTEGDADAKPLIEQFRKDNPKHYATVAKVADHIDHVVELAGIDHVGIGTDFDGVGDSLPTGLKDVSAYPNLIFELLKRGYSDEDIEKICSKNLFRVWNKVAEVASQLQAN